MVSMYRRVMRMIPATRRTKTGGSKGRMKPSPFGVTFNARRGKKTGGIGERVGLAAKEREMQLMRDKRRVQEVSRKKGRRKTKTGGALGTTRPRTTRRTGGGGR